MKRKRLAKLQIHGDADSVTQENLVHSNLVHVALTSILELKKEDSFVLPMPLQGPTTLCLILSPTQQCQMKMNYWFRGLQFCLGSISSQLPHDGSQDDPESHTVCIGRRTKARKEGVLTDR